MTFVQPPRAVSKSLASVSAAVKSAAAASAPKNALVRELVPSNYLQNRHEKWAFVRARLAAMPEILKDWRDRRSSERDASRGKKRPF